jgi:aldehyde:ferredoxin oxidoreductase
MKGYMGALLRVNLTTGAISEEALDPRLAADYIGGTGLGVRIAYDEIPPDADPLGPDSKLIFMTGPVTSTVLGTAGRYQLIFKSPLTGILCDSSSSGHWGSEFRKTGYDGLIVEGEAARPVYLYIHDGVTEIRDASHLWGVDTYKIQEVLPEEVGEPKALVLSIGPAGERGVLFSCMVNDAGRAPGRGGSGAVMGAKKLKAIVVRGTRPVQLADPEGFKNFALAINKLNGQSPITEGLRTLGTPGVMDNRWALSDMPVKNWSKGAYEELCVNLGGKKMAATMLVKHVACHYCPVGCSRWVRIAEGPYQMDAPGPEYETLGALGTLCVIDDLEAVAYAGHLCNIYGIDTISCGATIAFAMECYDKGLLTREDTGGIELTWGNKEAMIRMVEQIASGEGIGKLLGQGSRRMAAQLDQRAREFLVEVKGMELPMHDPRAFYSWAATYATSPRGACHLHGFSMYYEHKEAPLPEWGLTGFYPRNSDEHKGKIARVAQNWGHVCNSMVLCFYASFTQKPSDLAALINYATGQHYSGQDLLTIGDRIAALYRAYNYRCGIRRSDDRLPARVLTPLPDGGAAGQVPDLEYQLQEYYAERELEPDGRPSRQSLIALGLADVARDMSGC